MERVEGKRVEDKGGKMEGKNRLKDMEGRRRRRRRRLKRRRRRI